MIIQKNILQCHLSEGHLRPMHLPTTVSLITLGKLMNKRLNRLMLQTKYQTMLHTLYYIYAI